ncbi:hypothetical protein Emag_004030 [Eimeria magna]
MSGERAPQGSCGIQTHRISSSSSSNRDDPRPLRVLSITMVNPDYSLKKFLTQGYFMMRGLCSLISVYGDTRDQFRASEGKEKKNATSPAPASSPPIPRDLEAGLAAAAAAPPAPAAATAPSAAACCSEVSAERDKEDAAESAAVRTPRCSSSSSSSSSCSCNQHPSIVVVAGDASSPKPPAASAETGGPLRRPRHEHLRPICTGREGPTESELCDSDWLDLDVIDTTFVEGHIDLLKSIKP